MSKYPSTRSECIELAEQVISRQRDEKKRNALLDIVSTYQRLLTLNNNSTWYKIVPNCHCTKCGGLIYQQVSPFPQVTPGGNRIMGCPRCKTMSWKLRNDKVSMGDPNEM